MKRLVLGLVLSLCLMVGLANAGQFDGMHRHHKAMKAQKQVVYTAPVYYQPYYHPCYPYYNYPCYQPYYYHVNYSVQYIAPAPCFEPVCVQLVRQFVGFPFRIDLGFWRTEKEKKKNEKFGYYIMFTGLLKF